MMLIGNYANAEVILNEETGLFELTRNDLEEINILLEEGEMNKILVDQADNVLAGIKVDLTRLGNAIDDLKSENRKLKRQRTFFGILAGGSILASALILVFK